jgi:hypothetical protein
MKRDLVMFCVGFAVAIVLASQAVRADPAPALDRQLMEQIARSLADQVRATEKVSNATERVASSVERAGERCR